MKQKLRPHKLAQYTSQDIKRFPNTDAFQFTATWLMHMKNTKTQYMMQIIKWLHVNMKPVFSSRKQLL